jgi:hypothetical protein
LEIDGKEVIADPEIAAQLDPDQGMKLQQRLMEITGALLRPRAGSRSAHDQPWAAI